MAKVVHADRGNAIELLADPVDLRFQYALAYAREDALSRLHARDLVYEPVELVPHEQGHDDVPYRLIGLGIGDDVPSVEPLERMPHVELRAFEVDVLRNESEKLADPQPEPVEDLERVEEDPLDVQLLGEA